MPYGAVQQARRVSKSAAAFSRPDALAHKARRAAVCR
jgi:hypothetical protein